MISFIIFIFKYFNYFLCTEYFFLNLKLLLINNFHEHLQYFDNYKNYYFHFLPFFYIFYLNNLSQMNFHLVFLHMLLYHYVHYFYLVFIKFNIIIIINLSFETDTIFSDGKIDTELTSCLCWLVDLIFFNSVSIVSYCHIFFLF